MEAMAAGIGELGGSAHIDGDSLQIEPKELQSGVVDSYGDHRIAMALALVGLVVSDVEVANPQVVAKTWPSYWSAMTAAFGKSSV